MQKAISGYHLLMLLTNVDGKHNVKEDLVIRDWITRSFPVKTDLDKEMEVISTLDIADYPSHFHKQMNLFYQHSDHKERLHFLQFAMNMIKADGTISPEEHSFFNELFDSWNENHE